MTAAAAIDGVTRIARRQSVQVALFVEAPLITLAFLVYEAIANTAAMQDFAWLRRGALAVLHGRSPYVAPDPALLAHSDKFVYPPVDAYALVPVAVLPRPVSYVVFLLASAIAVAAALWLLGARDWRCYGLAFLTPPVFFALAVGALGPLLLLGLAGAWRFRHRAAAVAMIVGIVAVAKLFLWPLLVWLAATRRWGAAAGAAGVAIGSALVAWAGIGFDGLARYPDLLRALDTAQEWKSYSVSGLELGLGLPSAGRTATLGILAVAGCAATVALARKPQGDRLAFTAAILTSLLATPLLWLHYPIVLLAPIAIASRRLSWLWAAPLLLWASPHLEAAGDAWKAAFLLTVTLALGAAVIRRQAIGRPADDLEAVPAGGEKRSTCRGRSRSGRAPARG